MVKLINLISGKEIQKEDLDDIDTALPVKK